MNSLLNKTTIMNITIAPRKIFHGLLKIILFLTIANIIVNYMKLSGVDSFYTNLVYFFDVDQEKNLPTFYSALALLIASFLLLVISEMHKAHKRKRLQWIGLSLVFAFLSVDELTVIHEQLWSPMKNLFNTSGLLYAAWFIPYVALLLILFIIYAKFIFSLPKRVMQLSIISGIVFVLGAVVFEAISGYYDELYGQENLAYCFWYSLEELFEMCGVAIFIYALLLYMSGKKAQFLITIKERMTNHSKS